MLLKAATIVIMASKASLIISTLFFSFKQHFALNIHRV